MTYFPTIMVRYSLFVLKVLNPSKQTNQCGTYLVISRSPSNVFKYFLHYFLFAFLVGVAEVHGDMLKLGDLSLVTVFQQLCYRSAADNNSEH